MKLFCACFKRKSFDDRSGKWRTLYFAPIQADVAHPVPDGYDWVFTFSAEVDTPAEFQPLVLAHAAKQKKGSLLVREIKKAW